MSDGIVANTEGFVEAHPYATLGIAIGAILFIWYITSSSGTTTVAAAPADDSATQAAAQLGAAQIAANAQTTQAQISADAANTQENLAAQVANTGTAATEAVEIAATNASTAQAVANANATVGVAGDQATSNEFQALLAALTSYASLPTTTINTSALQVGQEEAVANSDNYIANFIEDTQNNAGNGGNTGLASNIAGNLTMLGTQLTGALTNPADYTTTNPSLNSTDFTTAISNLTAQLPSLNKFNAQ